jgi:hypothetical protein
MQRRQIHVNLPLIITFVITHLGILNPTTDDNLLSAIVNVVYRSPYPDTATVQEVLQELIKKQIDVGQLVKWSTDNCQQRESSTE